MTPSDNPRMTWVATGVGVALLTSAVALFASKLSLVGALFTLIAFLAIPKRAPQRRLLAIVCAVSGLIALVAVARFVVTEAVPGLVQGGQTAAQQRALSRLREVAFAQDVLRQRAFIDPDRDGVGSAALIHELAGAHSPRASAPIAVLNHEFRRVVETRIGPAAAIAGYLFLVCLPTKAGTLSASPSDQFDDERAEVRFVAYAWPADDAHGVHTAYHVDEHDRILLSDNREGTTLRYAGPDFPPACDAASRERWKPWRNKQPRTELPGARR